MEDWTAIEHVTRCLADFPARWAPFKQVGGGSAPAAAEVERGLEIVRQCLVSLGPVAPDEPTHESFPNLPQDRYDFWEIVRDLRAITGQRLRDFCEARRPEFKSVYLDHGMTLTGVARAIVRSLIAPSAGDIIEDVPTYYRPDPSDLRGLALKWLEDNAHCLRDGDLAGCMGLMVARVGMGLVPLAKRLYHDPDVGHDVKEGIELIFVPEVVEDIQSGG